MRGFLKSVSRGSGRSYHSLLFLVVFLGSFLQVAAQPDDRRIEAIRRLSQQVTEQIAESEMTIESTGVFFNELVVNKGDKSWPAVGIYQIIFRFHYTYGDREKNPYPDRLLKILVTIRRSDRHEFAEYLFNPAGQLVFYHARDDQGSPSEQRYYFAANRLIRRMSGQRILATNNREALTVARGVLSEKKKLVEIFVNSLGD